MTPTEKQELGASFDRATEERNAGRPLSTLAVLEKCQGDIRVMLSALRTNIPRAKTYEADAHFDYLRVAIAREKGATK